jgi:hypothetical protein
MAETQHFQLLLLKAVAVADRGHIQALALLELTQQAVAEHREGVALIPVTALIVEHAVLAATEQLAKAIQAAPVCVLM